MLGYVCLVAAIVICGIAIFKPIFGTIGFYFFALLDPIWNWRWVLSTDLGLQKWLFIATLTGLVLNFGSFARMGGMAQRTPAGLVAFLLVAYTSSIVSVLPQ
jgi:hypothetical protein